jgi:hypothetical protein
LDRHGHGKTLRDDNADALRNPDPFNILLITSGNAKKSGPLGALPDEPPNPICHTDSVGTEIRGERQRFHPNSSIID